MVKDNEFKFVAVKEDVRDLIKVKAQSKGMYIHRYIEQLVKEDKRS